VYKISNFESDFADQLKKDASIKILKDNTASYDDIDFVIEVDKYVFHIDAKEKKTNYRKAWVEFSKINETDLFILDELGIRKLFHFFPNFFVVIKDNMKQKYYLYNSFDVLCMDRIRLNRPIVKTVEQLKGKWLISYQWGLEFSSINELIISMKEFMNKIPEKMHELSCYKVGDNPVYRLSEEYGRIPKYWDKDVSEK